MLPEILPIQWDWVKHSVHILCGPWTGQIGQDWAGNLNWGGGVYFEHETSSAQNDDDTSGRVSAVMCPQFLCLKELG